MGIGVTRSLNRVDRYLGPPVVRGIQLGVALVLLETGISLGVTDVNLAVLSAAVAVTLIVLGLWNLTAIVVLILGGVFAMAVAGTPLLVLPGGDGLLLVGWDDLSVPAVEATLAQLAMTLGNAAVVTSVLLYDYFDREVSPDGLSTSMGVMDLVSVPFGAFPMCHGSGGVAGKYAFGARTAGANVMLGIGYVGVAVLGEGLAAAYPVAVLGVILALIALQLARTSLQHAQDYLLVIGIGVCGIVINLGVAFVAGILVYLLLRHRRTR